MRSEIRQKVLHNFFRDFSNSFPNSCLGTQVLEVPASRAVTAATATNANTRFERIPESRTEIDWFLAIREAELRRRSFPSWSLGTSEMNKEKASNDKRNVLN